MVPTVVERSGGLDLARGPRKGREERVGRLKRREGWRVRQGKGEVKWGEEFEGEGRSGMEGNGQGRGKGKRKGRRKVPTNNILRLHACVAVRQ